jgi:hypothetical protein
MALSDGLPVDDLQATIITRRKQVEVYIKTGYLRTYNPWKLVRFGSQAGLAKHPDMSAVAPKADIAPRHRHVRSATSRHGLAFRVLRKKE